MYGRNRRAQITSALRIQHGAKGVLSSATENTKQGDSYTTADSTDLGLPLGKIYHLALGMDEAVCTERVLLYVLIQQRCGCLMMCFKLTHMCTRQHMCMQQYALQLRVWQAHVNRCSGPHTNE